MQDLIDALIQVIHNMGATAIVGIGFYGVFYTKANPGARLALAQAIAWMIQGLGGAAFGFTTYWFYGHLPDIHGVAVLALFLKMGCVVLGFLLTISYALWRYQWSPERRCLVWSSSFALGVTALTSAAFLRWFS
jgi:hypothetical protein